MRPHPPGARPGCGARAFARTTADQQDACVDGCRGAIDMAMLAARNRVLPRASGRVLAARPATAPAPASPTARTRDAGLAIETAESYIAADAFTHRHAVAPRDTGPFVAAGVAVIEPWPP